MTAKKVKEGSRSQGATKRQFGAMSEEKRTIRTINTIATEQPGGDGVLYPLGRPALSREEAGYAGDAPTSASAEPSGSAPTGLATDGSAPASQPSGSPPVASPPFPPLAGKTPPATRAPARPLVLSGGFLDPSALGVSGPSGAGDTKPIVVKLTVGGVLVSSPKRKASATQGTRGVTDDVELRRRMALDGWTTEEKTRPGTQHVDRYVRRAGYVPDESRRRRGCDGDSPWRRECCDVDIQRRQVAATPRLRRG